MLKSEDLHNELIALNTSSDDLLNKGKVFESCVIRALILLIKLALNIRQNQANALRQQGYDLVVPKRKHVEH